MNGVKDYYNNQNKEFNYISSLDNSAKIKLIFEQPKKHWYSSLTPVVKLKITATPVFTYQSGNEGIDLKYVPKDFPYKNNIKEIYLGKVDSRWTSDFNINYILEATLTRGLYLIKASTEDGSEVFRDTIHVTTEGQSQKILINR